MRVEVTKAFQWAREGIHIESVAVRQVVEGRAAEIALEAGWGRAVAALPAAPENKAAAESTPRPPSLGEQAEEHLDEEKAERRAARRKRRF